MNTTFCRYCGTEIEPSALTGHLDDRAACPLAVGDWILDGRDEPIQIVAFTMSSNGRTRLVLCTDECEYNANLVRRA